MITLRAAQESDKEQLWRWRNDALTRGMSLTTDEVPWADHCQWFAGVHADPERHLLIGVMDESAVGTVRLDRAGREAEINITVAPDARGRGMGLALLLAAAQYARGLDINQLNAVIRSNNTASKVIFERAGYRACGADDQILRYQQALS